MHEFPAYSWVAAAQGDRVFYEGSAHLPQNTPEPLREARQQELEALRVSAAIVGRGVWPGGAPQHLPSTMEGPCLVLTLTPRPRRSRCLGLRWPLPQDQR